MNIPTLEKRHFVENLHPGMDVADLFLIAAAQQAQAKNGPYWRLEFRDARGSIGGKIWSPQSQQYPEISPGIAWVRGRVTSYREQPEIAVDSIRPLSAEEAAGLDLSLFLPAAARPPQEMLEELKRLAAETLTHEPWRRFIFAVLEDPDISRALPMAPAAKAMHHAYAGGLLEHTLSVCGLCMRLCDHYPALDRQTLFAGALCHDLGKLWELSAGLVVGYTTPGRLIGHISLALENLAPLIREAGLEAEHADHLRHLILSHHGTREFGSPVLPATAEALALHYADNLDAKLNQVEATLDTALGQTETGWSAYVPALERTLYRALKTPDPVPSEPDEDFVFEDDPLFEDDEPDFHLSDISDFPEFLFDDTAPLREDTFLPPETPSAALERATTVPPAETASVPGEGEPALSVETATGPDTVKNDRPAEAAPSTQPGAVPTSEADHCVEAALSTESEGTPASKADHLVEAPAGAEAETVPPAETDSASDQAANQTAEAVPPAEMDSAPASEADQTAEAAPSAEAETAPSVTYEPQADRDETPVDREEAPVPSVGTDAAPELLSEGDAPLSPAVEEQALPPAAEEQVLSPVGTETDEPTPQTPGSVPGDAAPSPDSAEPEADAAPAEETPQPEEKTKPKTRTSARKARSARSKPAADALTEPGAATQADPEIAVSAEPEAPVPSRPETSTPTEPEDVDLSEPDTAVPAESQTAVRAKPATAAPEPAVAVQPEPEAVAQSAPDTTIPAEPEAAVQPVPEAAIPAEPETLAPAEPEVAEQPEPQASVYAESKAVVLEGETPQPEDKAPRGRKKKATAPNMPKPLSLLD